MSTFSQWYKERQKGKDPRQVYWLCGSEPPLIEYIIGVTKKFVESKFEYVEYVPMLYSTDKEFWDEVYQSVFEDAAKIVVLRGAEKLKRPEQIQEFVATRNLRKNTYLIFVSNEENAPKVAKTDDPGMELPSWLKCLTSPKGQVIECKPFTEATAPVAIDWVKGQVSLQSGVAAHILNRADGDLRLVRDVCVLLRAMPGEPTISTVNELIDQVPRTGFVDALIRGDKSEALEALRSIPSSDYRRVLALLDSRIDLVQLIHTGLSSHLSRGEISRSAGKQGFLVPEYLDYAKGYSVSRVQEVRDLILFFDRLAQKSGKTGMMEAMVAQW